MKLEKIKNILKTGENVSVEFKKSSNKLPSDLFETICAFLNTKGGVIFLGVSDNGKILGINKKITTKLKKDIANLSNNPEKLSPTFFIKVQDFFIKNKQIIIIEVPESSQVHQTNGIIFVRNQDGDYPVKHPVEIAKIVNRKQDYHTEQKIFPQVKLKDFDSKLIKKTKNMIKNNMPENHWWELTDKKFLEKAGLYRKNKNGNSGFTLAAILFFGTDDLIQTILPAYKFEALLRKDNIDRYDDRITIRTNIIDAYDLLMSFINKHLNDPFYQEGDRRISLRSKIFRELVANIIAHREYMSPAPAVITIFANKIEFKNPNNPKIFGKIDTDNFSPIAKNPTISKLMLLMGRVEEIGSGIYNVKKYLPYYDKNATCEFIDNDFFSTIINFSKESINKIPIKIPNKTIKIFNDLKIEWSDKWSERWSDKWSEYSVREQQIIILMIDNPKISRAELSKKIGINPSAIQKQIEKLKKKEVIKRMGSDRGGYWKIIKHNKKGKI